MNSEFADRIKKLSPYLFAELERLMKEKETQGLDVISLSVGDPDLPPPSFVLSSLRIEAANPKNHNYSSSRGESRFRQAVADWYLKRFNVDLDPETEVIALLGSKEGLANIARAFVNPSDKVLVPDPGYPVYGNGSTILNGGVPITMPLLEENDFKPDIETIDPSGVKMMFLNYPNNPTGATVDKSFLKRIVEFAQENNIIVCYDNPYSEITFDNYDAPSILEIPGGKNVAVEFNSCSKTFNMTGDRIAFATGNEKLIRGLAKVKAQVDSGPSVYIQKVAVRALESYNDKDQPDFLKKNLQIYASRRDLLVEQLRKLGFACTKPKATFYLWIKCNSSSMEFTKRLLDKGVAVTPGIGFGEHGKNFVRFSLTQPIEKIAEACRRMNTIFI